MATKMLALLICSLLWAVAIAPRALSNDLRATIVYQRLVLNISVGEIAAVNGVHVASVYRVLNRYETYGSILPDYELFGETRGRHRRITQTDFALIIDIVNNDVTRYIDEIQTILYLRGGSRLSQPRIHYWLRRLGYTRQRLFHV